MSDTSSEIDFEMYMPDDLNFQEYVDIFTHDILQNASCRGIKKTLVSYITRVVEPVGWHAVWVREDENDPTICVHILVEVLNVSMTELEAEVHCVKICKLKADEPIEDEAIDDLFLKHSIMVPLLQLHATAEHDPSIFLAPTNHALNMLRFFYGHLFRPWDSELSDETDIFVDKYLVPRLKLYFDSLAKCIPQSIIDRIKSLIAEGRLIMTKLYALRKEMKAEDCEIDLEEKDVLACMELTTRLEDIQKEVEMLENPLIRNLFRKKDMRYTPPKRNVRRPHEKPVVHVVGQAMTFSTLKALPLNDDDVILAYDNLAVAVRCSKDGDTILLLPGKHTCNDLPWLQNCISLKGLDDSGTETVLESTTECCGDICINCFAQNISISNLTLRGVEGALSNLITVHGGKLTLKNVSISSSAPSTIQNGISVLGKAQLVAEAVKISNCEDSNLFLSYGSRCELKRCEMTTSKYGIMADLVRDVETKKTSLSMESCKLSEILQYGIAILANDIPTIEERTELNCLTRYSDFQYEHSDTNKIESGGGIIGFIRMSSDHQ